MTTLNSLSATIVQGNDVDLDFFVTDENGDEVDITGATIKWGMRPADNPAAALTIEKDTSGDVDIIDGPGGNFRVPLDQDDTNQSGTCGDFVHEAVITFVNGNTITVTDENEEPGLLTIRKSIVTA